MTKIWIYDAHSLAVMKSGVFCYRNRCVACARCDGTLSYMKTKYCQIMSTTVRQ